MDSTIYVDGMRNYGRKIGRAGPYWSHLMSEDVEALHAFALKIGLKRSWFQGDHYDIGSYTIYRRALSEGATDLSKLPSSEWLATLRRIRSAYRSS